MARIPWLSLILILAMAGTMRGAPANTPDRISFRKSGITIVCDRKDEAFARKFAERLPELIKLEKAELARPGNLPLHELKKHRQAYLATIAHYLGLKKPTKTMRQVFDNMLRINQREEDAMEVALRIDTVQIWREAELIAYLRERGADEYFELDKKNTLPVAKNRWTVESHPRRKAEVQIDGTTRKHVFLPVILKTEDPNDLDARVNLHATEATKLIQNGIWGSFSGFKDHLIDVALHEVVENGVITTYITSPDRRWFCEGVANFIAYRTLVDLTTPERARRYYDLTQQLAEWSKMENQVNLPKWKVSDEMTPAEQDSDLNSAQYAYATKVIADIVEKHGPDFLPRWFQKIGKTPRKDTTMKTVADAFERLTGEKLSSYYPQPLFPSL